MSNDKYQALRDAAERSIIVTVGSSSLISLLAEHDRMREALEILLNALGSATWHPAVESARKALKESERCVAGGRAMTDKDLCRLVMIHCVFSRHTTLKKIAEVNAAISVLFSESTIQAVLDEREERDALQESER